MPRWLQKELFARNTNMYKILICINVSRSFGILAVCDQGFLF